MKMRHSEGPFLEYYLAGTAARFATADTEILASGDWNQIRSPSFPVLSRNEIVLARRAGDAEAIIDQALRDYAGGPLKWCVSPFCQPLDLGERLLRRGFDSWEARLMHSKTERTIEASLEQIEDVGAETLTDYCDCFCEGWSIPEEYQSRVISDLKWSFETGRFHYFLGRCNGQPVATAGFVLINGVAYLMGAQVLGSARGQGLYRGLIKARLEALARMGVEQACTQAREASSAPILEKLGFETAFRFHCYAKDFV